MSVDGQMDKENVVWPWSVWLNWLEHRPVNWKVAGSVCGQGTEERQPTDVFLPHQCFSSSLQWLKRGGNEVMLVKGHKVSVMQEECSRDLMYSMVTTVNKTVLHPGWCDWAQTVNQRVASSIPSQCTCLGCGAGPQQGVSERQLHIDVSLPLFLPPFPSLK